MTKDEWVPPLRDKVGVKVISQNTAISFNVIKIFIDILNYLRGMFLHRIFFKTNGSVETFVSIFPFSSATGEAMLFIIIFIR